MTENNATYIKAKNKIVNGSSIDFLLENGHLPVVKNDEHNVIEVSKDFYDEKPYLKEYKKSIIKTALLFFFFLSIIVFDTYICYLLLIIKNSDFYSWLCFALTSISVAILYPVFDILIKAFNVKNIIDYKKTKPYFFDNVERSIERRNIVQYKYFKDIVSKTPHKKFAGPYVLKTDSEMFNILVKLYEKDSVLVRVNENIKKENLDTLIEYDLLHKLYFGGFDSWEPKHEMNKKLMKYYAEPTCLLIGQTGNFILEDNEDINKLVFDAINRNGKAMITFHGGSDFENKIKILVLLGVLKMSGNLFKKNIKYISYGDRVLNYVNAASKNYDIRVTP